MSEQVESQQNAWSTIIRQRELLALICFLLAGRIVMSMTVCYTTDDAFITYRFADNLARGLGFVYNPGEPVQGTSSPGFSLFLSGVSVLMGREAVPVASKVISLIADIVTLTLLWFMSAGMNRIARYVMGVLFALFPKVAFVSMLGMEAPLVVALMIGAYVALSRHRTWIGCAILGVLLVVRIDTMLWVLLALWFGGKSRLRLVDVSLMIIPIMVWGLFCNVYFGSIIPNTIVAKLVSWQHLMPLFDPVRVLRGYLPYHGLQESSSGVQSAACIVLLLPPLFAIARMTRRKHPLLVFPVFFVLYNLAFSFGRVLMVDWYYLPGFVSYFVTLGYCIDELISADPLSRMIVRYERWFMIAVPLCMIPLFVWGAARLKQDPGDWFSANHRTLGNWLRTQSTGHESVLLEPIGYVGWASGMQVDDYVGMVSPDVLEYRHRFRGSDQWYIQYLKDKLPTYVVLQKSELGDNRLFLGYGEKLFATESDREWFFQTYREVSWSESGRSIPTPLYRVFRVVHGK